MATEYVGSVVVEVDGAEAEATKLDVTITTGIKRVTTMNRTGRGKGFVRTIKSYDISMTVAMPKDGKVIDWAGLEGAKLTFYPLEDENNRTSYYDTYPITVGESYTVDNEAVVDVTLFALRRVKE